MIALTRQPIDTNQVIRSVETEGAGAVVPFVGTVRQEPGLTGLSYECYEPMAERQILLIADQARRQWSLQGISILHRIGWVPVGEASIVIAVSATHRQEAFTACRFLIDQIKEIAPIWKRKERDVTGVILAGGRSKRFGTNKAFATFQGVSMMQRVLDVMQPLFSDLFLVTNDPEAYASFWVPKIQDREPHLGPLGGIVTALEKTRHDRIFVVACDMPLLTKETILKILGGEANAVVPIHDGIREYLIASYSRQLLPLMEESLASGHLSMAELCGQIEDITWMPVEGHDWFNINTRQDLNFLEAHHAG